MQSYILTVTLNPAIDKTAYVDCFVSGHDHRMTDIHYSAGGKGINVSRALKGLRVNTMATGFLGGPEGECVQAVLKKGNIPHEFVPIGGRTRTSLAVIDQRAGRVTRFLEEGPTVKQKDFIAFRRKYDALLQSCEFVVLSGRNVPGGKETLYYDLIRQAGRYHKKVVLDTSGPALLKGLAAKPFLVKPNLAEAQELFKQRVFSRSALRKGLDYFLKAGAKNVILSAGAKGAAASDGKEYWLAVPPGIRAVSPVGCGDALIAGVLRVLLKKGSFQEAVKFGVAAGTANAMNIDPGRLDRRKVLDLAGRVTVDHLSH